MSHNQPPPPAIIAALADFQLAYHQKYEEVQDLGIKIELTPQYMSKILKHTQITGIIPPEYMSVPTPQGLFGAQRESEGLSVFFTDPPRGRPIGGGGVHRT